MCEEIEESGTKPLSGGQPAMPGSQSRPEVVFANTYLPVIVGIALNRGSHRCGLQPSQWRQARGSLLFIGHCLLARTALFSKHFDRSSASPISCTSCAAGPLAARVAFPWRRLTSLIEDLIGILILADSLASHISHPFAMN